METHARAGAVEIACWTIGLALCALYALARADAMVSSAAGLARFERSLNVALPSAGGDPDVALWSTSRLEQYRASTAPAPEALVGVLAIPAIDLTAPLYADARELHLNRGVGLIAGMDPPGATGNVGVAGHRDGFFRTLKDIELGDEIELRTRERFYRYRVTDIAVVERSDASALRSSEQPVMTLVTCHPFYFVGHAPRRFVVRGVLSSSRPLSALVANPRSTPP